MRSVVGGKKISEKYRHQERHELYYIDQFLLTCLAVFKGKKLRRRQANNDLMHGFCMAPNCLLLPAGTGLTVAWRGGLGERHAMPIQPL